MLTMSWRTRWRIYEFVRNSLWIVPLACFVAAIALGILLPMVDENTTVTIGIAFGADAARAVLGAIAGGMITFTGFVFSILLLAVQFGSSQFSPRMLRRFLRDPTTKAALGTFMATFTYALVVLREVGTGADADFVPNNSISVALALLVVSMLMFLRLLSRTTQGLRVASVLNELGHDAREVVDRVYPRPAPETPPDPNDEATGPADALAVTRRTEGRTVRYRGRPGVVQSLDVKALVAQAHESDALIRLVPRLADLVDDGDPLFVVHGGAGIDDDWLRGLVATGDERTMRQDPAFAFRLLADISAKALSPGVNDPTTSVQALDQIELLLRRVGSRDLRAGHCRDEDGALRLLVVTPSWDDLLSLAIDETRQYGEGSVQVIRRLRALLANVRRAVPSYRRAAVDAELALLDAAASRFDDADDQRSAATLDRQGLGAADRAGVVPQQRADRERSGT